MSVSKKDIEFDTTLVRTQQASHRKIAANLLVHFFEQNNPRFDKYRFLKACGLDEEEAKGKCYGSK